MDNEYFTSEKLASNFLADRYYFLLFGLGFERAHNSRGRFSSFELRYHMGWDSITHPDRGIDDFKENNIQFILGFSFSSHHGS